MCESGASGWVENSWVSGVSGARKRESGAREWNERVGQEKEDWGERERGVRGERKGEVSGAKE